MATAFSRSLRALEAEGFRFTGGALLLGLVLLGGWGSWLWLARVSLYAVTEAARLEVVREAHPVEAAVSAGVVKRLAQLGQEVRAGDVLVELDAEAIRLQIAEKTAERSGLVTQLEALRRQVEAQQQALVEARQAAGSALEEARARHQEAEAAARFASEQAARTLRMHEQGLVSDAERKRIAAEAEQKRAAASATRQSLARLEADRRLGQSEKRASVAELERRTAELQARLDSLDAALEGLSHEQGHYQIRAPVPGRLGELLPLPIGSEVRAGQRLGVVIPTGEMRIVAEYPPADAVGRVRPGQKARMRLEGFPWIQFGLVTATVTGVAEEARNGKIRVELSVESVPALPGGAQHGLPGSLEVEVERIAPASLVLRSIGRAVSRPGSPPRS